jgi:hypothetical protein
MTRRAASLTETVAAALEPVIARICARITEHVVASVANQVGAELTRGRMGPTGRGRRQTSRRSVAKPVLTRWVADRRARRVPTFVIEMTGLDTKKKIVAKFGADAAFTKGKPLPPVAGGVDGEAPKAKPPIIRKKAAAA